jgi:hypothetical protein
LERIAAVEEPAALSVTDLRTFEGGERGPTRERRLFAMALEVTFLSDRFDR